MRRLEMGPLAYRRKALSDLTTQIGCYALADLDGVPLYVGQSVDGIRTRVARHLTSARSDIIANRQLDVWEVAYVYAFPVDFRDEISILEATLYQAYNSKSPLINGKRINQGQVLETMPKPLQTIQVVSEDERQERLNPDVRLPRQADHYARLLDHYLVVKKNDQIEYALKAHFQRMTKYHRRLLENSKV